MNRSRKVSWKSIKNPWIFSSNTVATRW